MSVQPCTDAAWREQLGGLIVRQAEEVQDMGRRVAAVLSADRCDHPYAADKLFYALDSAARVLGMVGNYPLDDLLLVVKVAYEQGVSDREAVKRGAVL